MAVKIRLTRRGRKKLALYDIVVADARAPRDGRFIEKLGNYNPNTHPATVLLKEDKALEWLLKGAQPTNTAKTLLSSHGILFKKHLQLGVNKGAITQEDADKKLEAWKQAKAEKLENAAKKTQAEKDKEAKAAQQAAEKARKEKEKEAAEAATAAQAEKEAEQAQEIASEAKEEQPAENPQEATSKEEKPAEDKKEPEPKAEKKEAPAEQPIATTEKSDTEENKGK